MSFLKNAVVLVTGASRGIGKSIALRFAGEGAHVVALARDIKALERLDDEATDLSGCFTLVPLDLTDGPAIDLLAQKLFERHGKLDVLIGNAAQLGVLGPVGHISPSLWARVLDVNLTANWRLIRSFDPLLRAAPKGSAIFLTSRVGHDVRPYWGAYAVSKAGLEMLVKLYAEETRGTSVRVNLVDPGAVNTDMRSEAMPGEDPSSLPLPEALADIFIDLSLPDCRHHGLLHKAEV